MSLAPELFPPQNEAAVRGCAPLFARSALKEWFRLIPPEAHLTPTVAKLETAEGQADMTVQGIFGFFNKINRLRFDQDTDEGPYRVMIAPKCYNSVYGARRDGADIDLLSNHPLAWRQTAMNILELISPGVSVAASYNPRTARVITEGPLTVDMAERRLLGVHDFMQQYQPRPLPQR